MPSRLTDAEIVQAARKNLESAIFCRGKAAPIPLGNRWLTYARWARENIASLSHPVDIIRFAQTKFSFEVRESGEALPYAVAAYEWKILAEFPQAAAHLAAFFEPNSSDPNSVVLHKGKNMATYLCHLVRFHLVMTTYIRSPVDTICEIGGGYGAMARVWSISPVRKPRQYILVDLAESLFFAEAFLRYELPQLRIVHMTSELAGDADIVLCPLELLDRVRIPVDLVINTQSMSEMPEQWIEFYMDWLDRSGANHFFSFNTFGRPISRLHENVNVFSPRPSSNWIARLLRFPYDSDLAEILFSKVAPADDWKKHHHNLFEAMRHRALDRTTYLCAIDALRYLRDTALAAEFIERCLDELLTIPKELSYLADFVGDHPARQAIANARKAGSEGVVSDCVQL